VFCRAKILLQLPGRPDKPAGLLSLFAAVAKPPRKKSTKKMNFTSGSLTRVTPSRSMIDFVHIGINQSTAHMMTMKTSNQMLKFAKSPPSASTVPKSVMKQAARIILPIAVSP
jgi:hypothetical protein